MNRRQFNQILWAGMTFPWMLSAQSLPSQLITKKVPSTGEVIPAVGMGTWITFDHDPDENNLNAQRQVLKAFFAAGGGMIDSSPMYGFAQKALGHLLPQLADKTLFSATKVWVPGQEAGEKQMRTSMDLWGQAKMDLMQVHNLLDWQTHLPTLFDWKAQGLIRYVGVTTSHGRRHNELLKIIKTEPIDFVQFTYNMIDREAEQRLLPEALNAGKAVIINRPYQTGGLFTRVRGKNLPPLAKALNCQSWAQFFLKFVISHPAVTCAIPATVNPDHMVENMAVMNDPILDSNTRNEMVNAFIQLI